MGLYHLAQAANNNLCSAGRLSRWALAHILVAYIFHISHILRILFFLKLVFVSLPDLFTSDQNARCKHCHLEFSVYTHTLDWRWLTGHVIAFNNKPSIYYAASSVFRTNSLRRRRCKHSSHHPPPTATKHSRPLRYWRPVPVPARLLPTSL